MTTSNGTSVALGDATSWAENIVHTAINMKAADRLSGAALRLWETAVPLFEGGEAASPDHRQAVKLSLDALIMQPEVLAWVAREARDHLVKTEAAEETTSAPADVEIAPSPMYLEIMGILERGNMPPVELVDRFMVHDWVGGYFAWRIVDWVLWRAKVGRPLKRAADDDTFSIAFQTVKDHAMAEIEARWAEQDRQRGRHAVSNDDARHMAHSRP